VKDGWLVVPSGGRVALFAGTSARACERKGEGWAASGVAPNPVSYRVFIARGPVIRLTQVPTACVHVQEAGLSLAVSQGKGPAPMVINAPRDRPQRSGLADCQPFTEVTRDAIWHADAHAEEQAPFASASLRSASSAATLRVMTRWTDGDRLLAQAASCPRSHEVRFRAMVQPGSMTDLGAKRTLGGTLQF
jgi:acyl dehydratase